MGRVKERNGMVVGPDRLQGKRKEKEITRKIRCLDRLDEAFIGALKRLEKQYAPEITKKDVLEYELLICQCRESKSGGLTEKLFGKMVSEGTIDIVLFKTVKNKRDYREAVGTPNETGLVEEIVDAAMFITNSAEELERTMRETRERISSGRKTRHVLADDEDEEKRDAVIAATEELLRSNGFHQLIKNEVSGEENSDELLGEMADATSRFDSEQDFDILTDDVLEMGLIMILQNLEVKGVSIHSLDGGKIDIVYTLADAKGIDKAFRRLSAEMRILEAMSKMKLD